MNAVLEKYQLIMYLKMKNYATLAYEPLGQFYWGYIYNQNNLYVSDDINNCISIWNLLNKTLNKTINCNAIKPREIIPWNNLNAIVACDDYLVIINIEDRKIIKKIKFDERKAWIRGVKKITIKNLGESLICSDGRSIKLFPL